MIKQVQDALNNEFTPQGLEIDSVSFLGAIRFPPTIADAITAKMAATQKAQQRDNEIAQAQAEAQIQITKAKGEADANRILAASISPEILKLKELQNQQILVQAIADGKANLPTTYVTSSANTILPLK